MIHRRRNGLGSLIPGGEFSADNGPEPVPITAIAVNPYQPSTPLSTGRAGRTGGIYSPARHSAAVNRENT